MEEFHVSPSSAWHPSAEGCTRARPEFHRDTDIPGNSSSPMETRQCPLITITSLSTAAKGGSSPSPAQGHTEMIQVLGRAAQTQN